MEHSGHSLLYEGGILLGAALVCVLLFRRLGLGATLGYLVAGALVGPQVLGLVGGAEDKLVTAELGITLLLFVVGLELNPSRLWAMRKDIFAIGLMQVALCGLVLAGVVMLAAGFTWQAALALGLPLALSSTAQVLPMLQSSGRMKTPFGERAFSILLFQDISIVPLITIIAAMSRNPADHGGTPGLLLAIYTLGAVIGLILAGRYVLGPLFRLIGNLGEREMFVVAALFTVVASAGVMQMLGVSPALGAFVAGVMLAESPYRHELETDVEPFRSILLGLFFLSVGMLLDLGAIAERPLFVVGMALALVVVKTIVIFGIARLFGMAWRGALGLGLLLSQGGEFGFVLFAQASDAWLIEPEVASLFGAIVTLSMATTPFLMMFAARFRSDQPIAAKQTREGPSPDGANAIIVGYGRFGQTVAQILTAARVPVTLIDTDIEMIDVAGEFGAKVYFGDGTRIDLLRQAGAGEAELILFCLDGDKIDRSIAAAVHEAFPQASVFVRGFDRRSIIELHGSPVAGVVREVMESAVKLASSALDSIDVSREEITRAVGKYRATDAERLSLQKESGDIRAARDLILTRPR
ncbi:Kef-type potassium/proton antiporter (CPA2 family) [Novosphingobium kunmingense]|uniref:Kef-type potassium/proton antiporter (CPA2 family) n=1 Tax=Novosphingobium kunmingense TaxID=1211806 RepID=A0A2N0I1F6_9SPHN|nr:monovalent cation:proton antiporter-2 (CPA2) family protein [Novosphingobium kunmingense]PKB25023.1 Kef-type potassium/proton antiporter (CPA2 family) [Novosphingobium kunmingense]